jgi:hypothetical protein
MPLLISSSVIVEETSFSTGSPWPADLFEHGAADPHGDQPAVTGTLLP